MSNPDSAVRNSNKIHSRISFHMRVMHLTLSRESTKGAAGWWRHYLYFLSLPCPKPPSNICPIRWRRRRWHEVGTGKFVEDGVAVVSCGIGCVHELGRSVDGNRQGTEFEGPIGPRVAMSIRNSWIIFRSFTPISLSLSSRNGERSLMLKAQNCFLLFTDHFMNTCQRARAQRSAVRSGTWTL